MMMLRAAGMFLVALGFIWALQGAGLLNWPADSFMLGQDGWVLKGLVTATAGAALLGLARFRARR
jgi:hypothetical protein